MSKTDYYKTLGVEKNASADEIKKSYRALAMKFHPDKNPGDKTAEAKFKEINEAYEVLKDDQKRAAYDNYGHSAFDGGRGAGYSSHPGFNGSTAGFSDIFGDLFGDFMGGGGRASPQSRTQGSDLRYNLQVSLEDAFHGKQQTIKFTSSVTCDSCNGTGSLDSGGPVNCGTCKGHGVVRMQQGFFTVERTCSTCNGVGKIIKNPCSHCKGEGRKRKERTLSVNIPAGVEDSTRIRIAGEGEAGLRNAPSGDLYVFVSIKQHQIFTVEGSNLHCKVPIKMTTAALGGAIEVPTIDGSKTKVTIPSGTQSEDKFRLKGKGMSIMRSTARGDMYIHVNVETPVNLTKKQKELLEEFDNQNANNSTASSEGFFKKIKDIWG